MTDAHGDGNSSLTFESASFGGGHLTSSGVLLYVKDYLGSVRAVLDADSGALYKAVGYSAYGDDSSVSAIQVLPGGVGAIRAGAKAAAKADDVVDAARGADVTIDAAKATDVKLYVTYTKKNPVTGEVYSGRTSGYGDPRKILAKRDRGHHMNEKGFKEAQIDRFSTDPDAIRGREQYLIDLHGGAKSQGGTSGNAINGISPTNPNKKRYVEANEREIGWQH